MPDTPAAAALDLSGEWRAHAQAGDLARRFTDAAFRDDAWPRLAVPGHWRSATAFSDTDGPVLYRRTFASDEPAPGDRRFLTFDGIFYYGDVWLDGGYAGATEGYFFPHTFEITDAARRAPEHVLAVEVACPPQSDRTNKRAITGAFSHSSVVDPAWNPGGIWRPVRVRDTGPVRIKWLRVLCSEATETHGRLQLAVTLDPGPGPEPVPLPARLDATVTGPDGAVLATATRAVMLAGGDNRLAWAIDVDDPPRWWPWRLGGRPRCTVAVTVSVQDRPSDARRLRTAFREVRWHDWQLTVNGERLFAMGANQGPTRIALGDAAPEELRRDVGLAVEANLDLLRLEAHVTRPELYDAADDAGLLLWQDLPLQWSYARGTRRQAVRQAREMVDLLGHHPSVVLWCAHNEPFAVDLPAEEPRGLGRRLRVGASMFLPSWNKDVLDLSVARAIRKADPTRAVDPHSGVLPGFATGGTDAHLSFGRRRGRFDELATTLRAVPRLARFVSDFGVAAVPEHGEFMAPEGWPHLDWEGLAAHHGYEPAAFDRVVPPVLFEAFDAWRDATQQYQAAVIQLQVEDLRRLREAPAGGFCHRGFADGQPGVTAAVLDHLRAPKAGHRALRDACRTVLPMLEPRRGRVHVVNELRTELVGAVIEVDLDGRVRRFTGDIPAAGVGYVGEVRLGSRTSDVSVRLSHPAVGEIRNDYSNLVEWLRIVRG